MCVCIHMPPQTHTLVWTHACQDILQRSKGSLQGLELPCAGFKDRTQVVRLCGTQAVLPAGPAPPLKRFPTMRFFGLSLQPSLLPVFWLLLLPPAPFKYERTREREAGRLHHCVVYGFCFSLCLCHRLAESCLPKNPHRSKP